MGLTLTDTGGQIRFERKKNRLDYLPSFPENLYWNYLKVRSTSSFKLFVISVPSSLVPPPSVLHQQWKRSAAGRWGITDASALLQSRAMPVLLTSRVAIGSPMSEINPVGWVGSLNPARLPAPWSCLPDAAGVNILLSTLNRSLKSIGLFPNITATCLNPLFLYAQHEHISLKVWISDVLHQTSLNAEIRLHNLITAHQISARALFFTQTLEMPT